LITKIAYRTNVDEEDAMEIVKFLPDYGIEDAEAFEDRFEGIYSSDEDYARYITEEIGGLSHPEYYVYISDTDKRMIALDMADSYTSNVKYDGDERLIEEAIEAGMDIDMDEFENADEETKEQMLMDAYDIVNSNYADDIEQRLDDDPIGYFEEMGYKFPEDLKNVPALQIDYEKVARDMDYNGEINSINISGDRVAILNNY